MTRLEQILSFSCPSWEDLPDDLMFNRQLVDYLDELLSPIINEPVIITTTMIQNYSKREIIPKPIGRKYGRQHLAYLILIIIYKQVLQTEDIRKGVDLQLGLMELDQAYNIFARALNQALSKVFKGVDQSQPLTFEAFTVHPETEGVQVVAYAFAFRLLGITIIESQGYRKIGEDNE